MKVLELLGLRGLQDHAARAEDGGKGKERKGKEKERKGKGKGKGKKQLGRSPSDSIIVTWNL